MKLRVTVEGQAFEVEVGDVRDRPVVAFVDGERFEVWPEATAAQSPARPGDAPAPGTATAVPAAAPPPPAPGTPAAAPAAARSSVVRAPIPGVIVSIAARPGIEVGIGDELCVLEAMKMRNAIRATRSGCIAAVHVVVGQHVKHQDVLMEYEA